MRLKLRLLDPIIVKKSITVHKFNRRAECGKLCAHEEGDGEGVCYSYYIDSAKNTLVLRPGSVLTISLVDILCKHEQIEVIFGTPLDRASTDNILNGFPSQKQAPHLYHEIPKRYYSQKEDQEEQPDAGEQSEREGLPQSKKTPVDIEKEKGVFVAEDISRIVDYEMY